MMMMMMSVRPLCRTDGVRHLLICCTVSIVPPRCERRPRRRGVGSMLLRRLRSSGGWSLKRTGNGRTASVARRYLATRWARVLSTVASTELRLERDLRRIRKGPFSYYISTPPSPCIASYNTCDTSPSLKLYNTGQSSPPQWPASHQKRSTVNRNSMFDSVKLGTFVLPFVRVELVMRNREQCALPKITYLFIYYFHASITSNQHSFSPRSKLQLRYITLACTIPHPHIAGITNCWPLPSVERCIICGRPSRGAVNCGKKQPCWR